MDKIVKIESTELEKVVKESGLAIQEGEEIKQSYQPFLIQLAEIQSQASKINFESPARIDEEIAGRLRKDTVKIRTGAEELKNQRKRGYLLRGNLEQAAYNLIAASCKLTEETFGNVEKAREIAEKKRKEELKSERIEKLSPYEIDPQFYDLGNMPDEVFENLLQGAKTALENKIAAEKKAEEERLAKIEANRVENERIRQENEILKLEADRKRELRVKRAGELQSYIIFIRDYNGLIDSEEEEYKKQFAEIKIGAEQHWEFEREQQIKEAKEKQELEEKNRKERELQQQKLEAERKEREQLANELKAKQDAENKAKQIEQERLIAEENKRKQAEKAPDKEKIEQFAKMIDALVKLNTSIKDTELLKILTEAKGLLTKVSTYIREKSV